MASGGRKRKEYEGSAYHQRFSFGPAAKKGEGTLTLCAGPVGKKPSARGDGLDFEIEVEEKPWCLSPDELETWYHAGNKNMQRGTKLFEAMCPSAVKSVVGPIRELTDDKYRNFDVERVFEGGSFGKGTMVKGLSDVDLVVFIVNKPDLQPIAVIGKDKYKNALSDIITQLRLMFATSIDSDNKYFVKFKKTVSGRSVEFNLLPTTEENVRHFQRTNGNIFQSMLDVGTGDVGRETREFYSASFVEHQVRFVNEQPPDVKELICLVKYWASRFLPEELQKSYPLELITIYRCGMAEQPGRRLRRRRRLNKAQGLRSVLEVLTNLDRLRVYWNNIPDVDNQLNETIITKLNMKRPIILDPANPTNNVGGLYQGNNKKVIKDAAERTLRRTALLGNVREWPTI